MNQTLQIFAAFTFGVFVMAMFEYPALTTCLNGLNDKNAAIELLHNMYKRPGDGQP